MSLREVGLIVLVVTALVVDCRANLVFTETPLDSTVVQGHPASFHCAAYDNQNRGTLRLSWQHNGAPVNTGGRFSVFTNGTLYLTSTAAGDEGNYSCTASVIGPQSSVIEASSTPAARLFFAFIDDVFYHPPNVTAIDRQEMPAYFQCISGDSRPMPIISWEKDGLPVSQALIYASVFGGPNSLKVSGTLQLNTVQTTDAGRYQCIITNPLLPDQPKRSRYAYLTVNPNPGAPYISLAPSSQIVPEGQPATFPCVILGDPTPNVTWRVAMAMMDIINSSRIQVWADGSLHFASVTMADETSYVCRGVSPLGAVAAPNVSLTVARMDWTFITEPSDVEILQGLPATLICRPPASTPTANVTWYKDNLLYTPRPGASITNEGDLYFSAVTKDDEASYFCAASNDFIPRQVTSRRAMLIVRVEATITDPPSGTEVILGNELTLTCQATGDPEPTVAWSKDGRLLVANSRTTIGSNGLLHVRNIVALDEGTYSCRANNTFNTDTTSAFVNVLIPPQIVTGPGDLTAGAGSTTTIPCVVVGDPSPVVSWFKDDIMLQLDPTDPMYTQTNQGLLISEVRLEDAGIYRCRAESNIGIAESSGTLVVETLPVFTLQPTNTTVHQDMVVSFKCDADALPPATITWLFNDGAVPSWASVSSQGRVLSIVHALPESTGKFTCLASNSQGTIQVDAFLNVLVTPSVEPLPNLTLLAGQDLTVTCQASGSPDPVYMWLKGQDVLVAGERVSLSTSGMLQISGLSNSDQGWYSCVAHNDVGNARQSFYLAVTDVPGQPVILSVSTVSATSVFIVWVAGGDVDDTTHFLIQYRLSSSAEWVTFVDNLEATPGNQSFSLHGLMENREYFIRVVAKNVIGQSPPSAMEIINTPSVTGPSAPRNFRLSDFNATTVTMVWEVPAQRNGPIAVYLVEYVKSGSNDYGMQEIAGIGQATVMTTVSGLRPVTLYRFRVCAATLHNGERQWGNCTDYLQQETLTAAPDAPPSNISVSMLSSTTLNVSWTAIPEMNQNGQILGYNVLYRDAGSQSDYTTLDVDAVFTSPITGLTPWTTYEVKVQGFNINGSGPATPTVEIKTQADSPTASPDNVTVSTVNQTAINVSWQAVPVADRRGPIDGYTLFYRATDTTDFIATDFDPSQMMVSITGLNVAQSYEVQVLAFNLVNEVKLNGPKSRLRVIATADGIPGPVNSLTAVRGSTYVYLQWNPPVITNGEILGYIVEYRAQETVEVTTMAPTTPSSTPSLSNSSSPTNATADAPSRKRRQAEEFRNDTYGFLDTTQPRYNLTNLQPETEFWIGVAARTSGGTSPDVLSIYVTTGMRPDIAVFTTPVLNETTTTKATTPSNDSAFFNLFNLPRTSLILFLSIIGAAFLAIIIAILVISVWCRGRRSAHHVKRKATLLLPNDGRGSPGGSTPSDDIVMGSQSRSGSNTGSRSHSPSNSSGMTPSTGLPSTPATTPIIDEPMTYGLDVPGGPLDPNRPRASSSPASAQLSVKMTPRPTLPSTASLNLYPTAPNPRSGRHGSSEVLDTTPAGLDALYSRVNRNQGDQGPTRLKKDSLAAIAVLLDQEENDAEMRPLDSPPSVVIANQRTTL